MKSAPVLLRWTRFASDPGGTGPEKRSAQILALAREAGFEVSDMRPPASTPRFPTLLAGAAARFRHGPLASVDRAGPGLLGYRALFYRRELENHRGVRVLLWETTYDRLLPDLALRLGYKIVALPHNLESLVSEKAFASAAHDPMPDLGAEISRLRLAHEVFVISREERWLLEARGLSPRYLPFHPCGSLAGECAAIRARRLARAQPAGHVAGPLLVLGSAFNPATARGMRLQLEWLSALGDRAPGVVVAGPATETELASFSSSRVRILGRVSRETLIDLLSAASALLVHTQGGGGAVTRLPEALLAGLPVIANSNAARDQFGAAGLHVYETGERFSALVSTPLPIPPPPPPPVEYFETFRHTLRRLASS